MNVRICKQCSNNDETCSMCPSCSRGSNFESKQKRRAKIIMIAAVTIDGFIAKNSDDPVEWTGSDDKSYFRKVTEKAGVVIMGSNTFNMIGRPLPNRMNIVMTSKKKIDINNDNVELTDAYPTVIVNMLENRGYKSICVIGGSEINTLFLKCGLIDELHVVTIPKIMGCGISLFNFPINRDLELIRVGFVGKSGGPVLTVYKPKEG